MSVAVRAVVAAATDAVVGQIIAGGSDTVASVFDYMSTAVDEAAQLDKRIREIGVLTGKVADGDIKKMRQELEALSVSSGQSMELLADAKYDIVNAGFTDVADSALLLSHSASLAVAGVTEVTTAADLLTQVLGAYNREASSASEVSDDLFTIVRNGSITMDELDAHLTGPITVAAQEGVEFDEVGATMSALTSHGQPPEQASTAITAAISELSDPSEEMTTALKTVDVESDNLIATAGGLKGALDLVQSASEGTGVAIKKLISDENALLAVTLLTSSASESFSQNLLSMANNAGVTDAAVSNIAESSGFLTKQVGQAFESAQRGFGSLIEGNEDYKQFLVDVRDLVGQFAQQLHEGNPVFDAFVSALSKMGSFLVGMIPGAIGMAIEGFRGWVAAIGTVERSIRIIYGLNQIVAGSLVTIGGAALQAGSYLVKGLSLALEPIKLVAQGIDLVGEGFARISGWKWDSIEHKIVGLQDNISSAADDMKRAGQAVFESGQDQINKGLEELANVAKVKERYDELDKALQDFKKALVDNSSVGENNKRQKKELSDKVVTSDGQVKCLKDKAEDNTVKHYSYTSGRSTKEYDPARKSAYESKNIIQNEQFEHSETNTSNKTGASNKSEMDVFGHTLNVTESESDEIEKIKKGIDEQVSVLNHVADGLDMVGYDLKGVGNFATTIEQLTLASKLDHPDFDKTKAYVAGISSLFQGIGANIGGDVGAALSSMGSMAATGASIGSAIPGVGTVAGAVIGGAVGLISSIFGGDDEEEREEAEREKMRQQIYQGMLSRSLSGAGPYSLKMLRESGWKYGKLKRRFGNRDQEALIKYQNRLELLDDIGASLEKIGSPEIVRNIDLVRAKYEYAAKSVKGMLDITSAEMTEISALVFGLTADNLVTMFDSAIETAEDADHAGRLIAEALELQIVDSFKKMAISQAVNDAVMPMLQPILNELVSGALSGGLSPGEMADLVLQAQEIAASVAPAVSALYGAFDEAGVLNYTYNSDPFEARGSMNEPVITGNTSISGQNVETSASNHTQGQNRPMQVVVQVGNREFESIVTELADEVFVRAERRKGVVNAQKVFG